MLWFLSALLEKAERMGPGLPQDAGVHMIVYLGGSQEGGGFQFPSDGVLEILM